jgi:hyperosmotically inducible protein
MRHPRSAGRRVGARIASAAAVALICWGCATAADPRLDARIEAQVKARLVAEKDANLTRLDVVSRKATVYLSGTVESPDQKTLAETVAKTVPGVDRVVNNVTVR